MDRKLGNALLAEFFGTFTLVFIGAAVVATLTIPNSNGSVVVPALGHGLIVLALVFAFGSVSGGHFNPAVTAAMLVAGKIPVVKSILYWVAQFGGAIIGAIMLSFLISGAPGSPYGQAIGVMTGTNLTYSALIEGIATFIFVTIIYQVADNGKAGNLAPLVIVLALAGIILAVGAYTGASLNPARTLGPALAAGDLSYVPAYFIGIFAGGVLAGLFNGYLYKPE